MSGRPSRGVANIPIPRNPSSSTSPTTRNIESLISIPFAAGRRPRPGSQPMSQRSGVADDHRGSSVSQGVRGSSSFATVSPSRLTARSHPHSSSIPARGSPRLPITFEPRVIRASDTVRNAEPACLPSSSTSPSRARRASGAGARTSSAQRNSTGPGPPPPPSPLISFARPAYLDHSSLRHLLQTETPPNLPPGRRAEGSSSDATPFTGGHTSTSPATDSDDESNVSPPRDIPPAPPATFLSYDPILKLPMRWSDQVRHPLLSVSGDGRELTYHGPSSSGEKDAAAARTIHSIPPACGVYYYEVDIVSKGQKGHISIGFAARDVRLSRLPGWEKNSWGYHGDDGFSFAAQRDGTPYGPMFGTGDVIGCGIDFAQNRVFYTKNGAFLGMVFDNVGTDVEVFPSVGLRHTGEAIRVNFGHEPFKYDIEYYVQHQRSLTWLKIQSTPLNRLFASADQAKQSEKPKDNGVSEEKLRPAINELVLSYLAHHGYAKTARAFQAQSSGRGTAAVELAPTREDHDIDMDDVPSRQEGGTSGGLIQEGDIELRTRIVNSVIAGDIDTVLNETERYYPAVLEQEEGLMLFKLRCRKFVELILEASEMKKKLKHDGSGREGYEEELRKGAGMDVDDDISPVPSTNTNGFVPSAAIPIKARRHSVSPGRGNLAVGQYESALNRAISYGQTLHGDYTADKRPEVQMIFGRTFGIVAWDDPIEAGGEAAEVAGHEARITLASELNQAILKSQGRPGHPALERLYRQTAACVMQLGLLGVGAAAFADMPKEFLDA